MSTTRRTAVLVAAVLVAALATLPVAAAKDGDVRVRGICTKGSTAKLKLSNENGRIEIELEVDQNRTNVPWKVALRRNGALVATLTATTRAPSGSFSVRRVVSSHTGTDRIVGVGTSPSGERCTAQAAL